MLKKDWIKHMEDECLEPITIKCEYCKKSIGIGQLKAHYCEGKLKRYVERVKEEERKGNKESMDKYKNEIKERYRE